MVKNVNNKVSKLLMYPRQYTRRARIAQSSALPPVADEPASPLRDVSEGEACPIDSGFGADQDRANIAKTSTLPMIQQQGLQRQHSEMVSKFEAQELGIKMLKARVKLLEDKEGGGAERSGDDAPIKERNSDEGEAAAERVSDDTEEMATVLTSIDAATVLASRVVEVPNGSGSIPTTGPPAAEVPTAGLIFATATVVTPYTRRKGKEIMVESETLKKKKVQEHIDAQVTRELEEQMVREDQRMFEQVARDAEIARIHAKEELQIMIDGLDKSNETVAKYLQEYHQFASDLPLERRIKLISDLVRYQDNYVKGDSSGTPTESHHTPTSEASQSSQHHLPSSSLPPIPTEPLPTVIPSDNPPLKKYTRRTRIAQSSVLSPIADEPASPLEGDSQGEACPTNYGFQADQDRANIAKTSTLPSDSAPRVTSLAANEGSMQQKLAELTALCTSLQRQQSKMVSRFEAQELEINSLKARIKLLEDKDIGVVD
nr:hypothetical protein [Tanacetum cinerariifolium]